MNKLKFPQKIISQNPVCVHMFSPSSYRTPRRSPISPTRFQMWNTPSPRTGFKTPAANQFLSTGKRRRNTTSIIRRSPALNGFARTGGVFGRFQPSGVESKFLDINANSAGLPAGASWGLTSINPVPIGDGPSGRIGRQITITSIQAMYQLDVHHTESNTVYMRLMFVLDKQCNGAAPAYLDIMNVNSALAYRNLDNSDRFVVLHDKFLRFTPSTLSAAGSMRFQGPKFQQMYRKCNIPIIFDNSATSGALTTIRSNNIVMIGYLYGASTNLNDFKGIVRIRYRDD